MGADDDIDGAQLQPLNHIFLLLGGAESAKDFNPCRKGGEALSKGGVVLLGQDSGRH